MQQSIRMKFSNAEIEHLMPAAVAYIDQKKERGEKIEPADALEYAYKQELVKYEGWKKSNLSIAEFARQNQIDRRYMFDLVVRFERRQLEALAS